MTKKIICTIIDKYDLGLLFEALKLKYNIKHNKVYIFESKNDNNTFYCTYKVKEPYELLPNSFVVHRNADTNTLFTLNAMNKIIKLCNNGKLVKFYKVQWQNYENMLVTLDSDELVKREINLKKIKKIS